MHTQQGVNTRVRHAQPAEVNIPELDMQSQQGKYTRVRHAQPTGVNIHRYQRIGMHSQQERIYQS
jgi:hypothetical protein